ncbi:MAG: flagellar biosynthetic protein FliO [Bacillus sp. (in: firmicutes)]
MKRAYLVKKIILAFTIVMMISSFYSHHVAFGKEGNTVYDTYQKDQDLKRPAAVQGTKPSSEASQSLVPQIIKFIFSFAAIIILLLLFLRFLKSKSKHIHTQGPFYSVGGHSLGGNRSLQLLMIGQTLYILGIGNEVRLLRTIEPGEEQDSVLQALVQETGGKQRPSFFSFNKKPKNQPSEDWEQALLAQINQVNQSSFPINKLKD